MSFEVDLSTSKCSGKRPGTDSKWSRVIERVQWPDGSIRTCPNYTTAITCLPKKPVSKKNWSEVCERVQRPDGSVYIPRLYYSDVSLSGPRLASVALDNLSCARKLSCRRQRPQQDGSSRGSSSCKSSRSSSSDNALDSEISSQSSSDSLPWHMTMAPWRSDGSTTSGTTKISQTPRSSIASSANTPGTPSVCPAHSLEGSHDRSGSSSPLRLSSPTSDQHSISDRACDSERDVLAKSDWASLYRFSDASGSETEDVILKAVKFKTKSDIPKLEHTVVETSISCHADAARNLGNAKSPIEGRCFDCLHGEPHELSPSERLLSITNQRREDAEEVDNEKEDEKHIEVDKTAESDDKQQNEEKETSDEQKESCGTDSESEAFIFVPDLNPGTPGALVDLPSMDEYDILYACEDLVSCMDVDEDETWQFCEELSCADEDEDSTWQLCEDPLAASDGDVAVDAHVRKASGADLWGWGRWLIPSWLRK